MMVEQPIRWQNELEPPRLIDAFLTHPPEGFVAQLTPLTGTPVFTADYDLTITLEDDARAALNRIPLFGAFRRRFLSPRTVFAGTTVSEYLILGTRGEAKQLVAEMKDLLSSERAKLLVLKDVPLESPLLSERELESSKELLAEARRAGFTVLAGQALAYVPVNFSSIDEYLQRLSHSRRKNLRRKLKSRAELSIETAETGDSIFADAQFLRELYQLYLGVYEQSIVHFDKLTEPFFNRLFQDAAAQGVVFLYRHHGELIGFNLCFVHNGNFVDKYIGLRYPAARDLNLYFVSWFVNLEYARTHGLKHYIAGWTDPEVKKDLGAQFTLTMHAVYFRSAVLRTVLKPFQRFFERDAVALGGNAPAAVPSERASVETPNRAVANARRG